MLTLTAGAAPIMFDFDTGSPTLVPTMGLPQSQTRSGLTAMFTGRFSIQSDATTSYGLGSFTTFSGNYLYPNDVFSPSLEITFNHTITSIMFDFVTVDFGMETMSTLRLTAYNRSLSNPTVGSGTQQACCDAGWGTGTLTFASATPFDVVDIAILGPGSDFLADNFMVQPAPAASIPEPVCSILVGLGAASLFGLRRRTRRS